MRFIVASSDYAGLGFAMRLQEEGHETLLAVRPSSSVLADPALLARFESVGDGLVAKEPLASAITNRRSFSDAYWIWDSNHSVEENELLRAEGFRVLGGGRYCDRMEHDRTACLDFVSRCGLRPPPSFPFSDTRAAERFCEQHAGTAYVYKPDQGAKFETFVPEADDPTEANEELRGYLTSLSGGGGFVLQERKEGVEANVEVWFDRGRPTFSFLTLECKRKYALDLGPFAGCALDFAFVIPIESRAVMDTVGKLFPVYREMQYTGYGDANVIAGKEGVWFLEKCERLGYNAHPNLFWNLARRPIGETFAALTDGGFEPDFGEGFGASVTMSTREGDTGGGPLLYPQRVEKDIYFWDVRRSGGRLVTAGFDPEGDVLVAMGHGYTMPTAWEAVMKTASAIRFPFRHYRPDGDQTNFPSSPVRRYEALKAMGYI
ncbi:MAG TPA: hypothetical protein VE007_01300 [Thermoanaerobaculia bacterium]|nr:hypothetical protein [Thermoanaerobaculia bacterium]